MSFDIVDLNPGPVEFVELQQGPPGVTGLNFGTIIVSGQADVVADNVNDVLTLAAGSNVVITTNAATDTISIDAVGITPDTQTALDAKVDENTAITPSTATKITYDAKGLVTGSANATTADIADSADMRYVTDAEKTKLSNLSGTNTGDQDLSGLALGNHAHAGVYAPALNADDNYVTDAEKTKLSNLSGTNTGDQDLSGLALGNHAHAGVYAPALNADDNYVTDAEKTKLSNLSGTNTGDQDLSGLALGNHAHAGVYAPALNADDNYVTDAEKTKLSNLSGTNTGDQDLSGLALGNHAHAGVYAPALNADDNYVTDAEKTKLSNLSGTNTGDQTDITGNAGTTTKLATPRTIDGVSFDGSANITTIAPGTVAAISKITPVDADVLPIVDSEASNALKKLTWANLKLTVKAYFDTLYATINQVHFVGTTSIAANRASAGQTLTGVSIDGNAATVSTNANATGPITLTGNTTSITSQTGTGTKLVVDTAPVIKGAGTAAGKSLSITNSAGTIGLDIIDDGSIKIPRIVSNNLLRRILLVDANGKIGFRELDNAVSLADGPFGQYPLYSPFVNNLLFAADKRFTVTYTNLNTVNLPALFNSNYDSVPNIVLFGDTAVINIDLLSKGEYTGSGLTYPEGWIYVHFYHTYYTNNVSVRLKTKNSDGAFSWRATTNGIDVSRSTPYRVLKIPLPSIDYYCSDIEISVVADTVNGHATNQVWLTQIEFIVSRSAGDHRAQPVFSKSLSQSLYGITTWKNSSNVQTAKIDPANGSTVIGPKLSIGTTNTTGTITIDGNSPETINVLRHTIADTAGVNLSDNAGGATIGATNKNGGDRIISAGIATGSGSSKVQILTATPGAPGTADRNPSVKVTVDGVGDVGIGVASPTATLHIKAGTASAGTGQIKLDSSVLLTTPEANTFENTGARLNFTLADGIRRMVSVSNAVTAPSNVFVGTSPRTIQNTMDFSADYLINGGTVSLIEYSKDGSTWYTTSMTGGFIPVSVGHYCRVTFSSAPTITLIPR